jgi:GAF domain-containing protein
MMSEPESVDPMLQVIVRAALQSVPGFDHVSISITHLGGEITTVAATDSFVRQLDGFQYELNEGPCLSAIRDAPVVLVEHATRDERWPNYMPRAVEAGLRSQLALRLYTGGDTWGGLNLYSTDSDTVHGEALQMAELFATHAALALGKAQQVHPVSSAVESRQIIGQAMGILIERYKVDEERAFQFLMGAASNRNTRLRDIAQRIVNDAMIVRHPGD